MYLKFLHLISLSLCAIRMCPLCFLKSRCIVFVSCLRRFLIHTRNVYVNIMRCVFIFIYKYTYIRSQNIYVYTRLFIHIYGSRNPINTIIQNADGKVCPSARVIPHFFSGLSSSFLSVPARNEESTVRRLPD